MDSSPASTTALSWPETPDLDSRRNSATSEALEAPEIAARDGYTSRRALTASPPRSATSALPNVASTSGFRRSPLSSSGQPFLRADSAASAAGNDINDDEDDDDSTSNVIMTLMFTSSLVSAAAYDMDTGILYGVADQG